MEIPTKDIVEPIVPLVAGLEQNTEMKLPVWLLWSRSLKEDVGPVVGLQVVPSVCREDTRLWVCHAPVCTKVEDLA